MKKMTNGRMGLIGIMIIGLLIVLAPGAWAQQGKSTPEKQGKPALQKSVKPSEEKPVKSAEVKQSKKSEDKQGEQAVQTPLSPQDLLVIKASPDKVFDPQATDYLIFFPMKQGGPEGVKALYVSKDGLTLAALMPHEAIPGEVVVNRGTTEICRVQFTPVKDTWNIKELLPEIIFLIFLVLLAIGLLMASRQGKWSLSDALSEYLEVDQVFKNEEGKIVYQQNSPEPVMVKIIKPTSSSSRLIAFIGLAAIITWIMTILIPAAHWFALTGSVPKLSDLSGFLIAQAGIFTPYIANRISTAIKRS